MVHTPLQTQLLTTAKQVLSTQGWQDLEYSFEPETMSVALSESSSHSGKHTVVRHPSLTIRRGFHYVYLHFAWTSSDQTILEDHPFYVGQGTHTSRGHLRRCYESHTKHQKRTKEHPTIWSDKVTFGFSAWILNNLSQEDANQLEMALISLYGRLDEGQGPLVNRTSGGHRNADRKPAVGWHHSPLTRKKQSQKAQGRVHSIETRKLMSQQRRGVAKTEAHKKALSQAHLDRNQTTPQVRSKCLYCDVVASPANLATYHNDHCIHRPGYEAINQARRDQISGKRMNRRNELIEGRRQWLHQTLDSLSPQDKQATGLMSPVKQKGKIQQVWGPIPYQCETTGQWYSVNLKEATRQYKEWVASQDRNKT